MISFRSTWFSITALLIFFLSVTTDMYRELAVLLTLSALISTLDRMGRGIVLREVVALHTCITCLIMPIVGYAVYNRSFREAYLLRRYMRVPEEVYFGYALPAIALFVAALCMAVTYKGRVLDEGAALGKTLQRIRTVLATHHRYGFFLVLLGMGVTFVLPLLPGGIRYFANLFYFSAFAGILYIYFSPTFRGKAFVIALFFVFLMAGALRSGMFTVLAYMGATIFSFFLMGKRYPLWGKVTVFASALALLLVLQNAKTAYRDYVWKKTYAGDRTSLFASLFVENLQKGKSLVDKNDFFLVHLRVNQGFNVSVVMDRMPKMKPHDGGKALSESLLSAIVPRIFWPDKPIAGGKANMLYYAGWRLTTMSTNIGPLGEAYGAFGVAGGIFFMGLLGLFIRWVYARSFRVSEKLPLVVLWIPVLFYQTTYSAETDTLQIMNSLVKTAFFMWLLYKAFPPLFGGSRSAVSSRNSLVHYTT